MKGFPLCAILLLSLPASATISQVQSKANFGNTAAQCQVTFNSNPATGDMIAVWTSWTTSSPNTVTVASVSDGLNSGQICNSSGNCFYTGAVGPTVQSASNTAGEIFYAANIQNPHSLSDTITVAFSSAPSSSNCVVVEYTGADIYYPLDSVSAGYSTSGNRTALLDSGNAAPANSNLIVFAGGVADQNTSMIAGGGFTSLQASHGAWGTAIVETSTAAIIGNNTLQRATACIGASTCPPGATAGNWAMDMAVFRDASWAVQGGWSPVRVGNVVYADQFPGVDIGDQINHAYAASPPNGGHIIISAKPDGSCYNFTTPIVLNTAGKYVLLEYAGSGGLITNGPTGTWAGCLNFNPNPNTGAAITLDYATATTDSLSPIHGLRNIVLVNGFCAKTGGCGSSATGILICGSDVSGCASSNRGIQSATMENVSVSGFSVGYQNNNFYSDPVLWLNPHFFGNGTAWVIGDVSTQTVYGGFFTGNGTALAAPTGSGHCGTGCFTSEISFYGTTFVENTSWVFDYSNNTTCCAKLDLFGVHLEQYMCGGSNCNATTCAMMPPVCPQHALQGKVDFPNVGRGGGR